MSDEPILCFDGDAAGRKAAFRAVETALPLLKPGHSVRFAFLPGGLDPDDLVRQHGRRPFAEDILATDAALFDVLWEREERRTRTCRRPSSAPLSRRGSRRWSPRSPTRRTLALRARAARDTVRSTAPWYASCAQRRQARIASRRQTAQQHPARLARARARQRAHGWAHPRGQRSPQPRWPEPTSYRSERITAPPREALLMQTLAQSPLAARRALRGDGGADAHLRPLRPPARCSARASCHRK